MKDQLYPEPENPYEFEKELKSTGKVKATGLVTTALIIAGGLLGGAAFAVNAQSQADSNLVPSGQTVVDNGSPVVSPTDTSTPAPVATDSTSPVPVDSGHSPAAGNPGSQSQQNSGSSAAPAPAAPAPSATSAPAPAPTPSSTPKTIAVPPAVSFGGGGDDNGEHHDGKHKRNNSGSTLNNPSGPNFGNGDDNGGDD
jgi:hypothetical protein